MISGTARNVVLIVLDSARADTFRLHAPTFASFARTGVDFREAVAPAGWTLPSHVSMFTGLSPTQHRVTASCGGGGSHETRRQARSKLTVLGRDGALIAPWLSDRGVRTLSVTPNPWLWRTSGLDTGFSETDHFDFLQMRAPARSGTIGKRIFQARATVGAVRRQIQVTRAKTDKGAGRILRTISAFVDRPGPFFVFANVIETHQPHLLGGRGSIRDALEPPLMRTGRLRAHNWGIGTIPPSTLDRWKRAYEMEIQQVDRWIGDLMVELERARVIDDTVVIVLGDHGEAFGEGGRVEHGLSIGEGSAKVPCAMWGAGLEARVVTEPVALYRLAPTIKELSTGAPVDGSLLDNSERGTARMEIEDPVCVSSPPPGAARRSLGPGAAFYEGTMKLAIDPFQGTRLFDLSEDPAEANPLDPAGASGSLQEEAAAWRKRVADN